MAPANVLVFGHIAAVICAIVTAKTWAKTGRTAAILLAAGCVCLAILTFLAVDPQYPFWDYRTAYYPAGNAVLDDPASLAVLIGKGVNGFVNLPIVAYLFAPFSMLSLRYAIGLFTVFGLAITAVAWFLLAALAELKGTERWLLLLLVAANGPLMYSIKEGNTSHVVLAALAGGLYLLRAKRSVAAGLLLGVAAVVKLPLLLFGVYFVLRRDWRGTLGFAGVCFVVGMLSVILFGWQFHVRWFQLCVLQFGTQWLAAFNVQSIQSFILRLHVAPGRLTDWTAYSPGASQRLIGYVLIGLLYLAALWSCIRGAARLGEKSDAGRDLEFLLVLCLVVVSSPLSWSHYYSWLLLPAAFHLKSESPFATGPITRSLGWAAIILATVLVRPLQFSDPALLTAYSTVGASNLLCGGLIWTGLIAWSLARSGGGTPSTIAARPGWVAAWTSRKQGSFR